MQESLGAMPVKEFVEGVEREIKSRGKETVIAKLGR
jgi:hypothetical protein